MVALVVVDRLCCGVCIVVVVGGDYVVVVSINQNNNTMISLETGQVELVFIIKLYYECILVVFFKYCKC